MTTALNANQPLFCPECGQKSFLSNDRHRYACGSCGFTYYHNVAATASVIMRCRDEILFSVRGRHPAKGKLDFPGGFVDPNESLEQALTREIQEELAWRPDIEPRYLFSYPNTYDYANVTYETTDAFFLLDVETKPTLHPQDDVAALQWRVLKSVSDEMLAFASMRSSVNMLREIYAGHRSFTWVHVPNRPQHPQEREL